jgi:hypothetical protein
LTILRLHTYPLIESKLNGRSETQQYAVWCIARAADPHGRGWLATGYLEALCHANGIAISGIIPAGNGRFWTVDEENGRIWLHGMKKVAGDIYNLHPNDVKAERGDVKRLKERVL